MADTRTHRGHDSDPSTGRLEVRCPNCHTSLEVAVDTSLTELTCSSCGSHFSLVDQSQATNQAPPLSKLGRFDLIERLGIGGFGTVWKARDKELDRTVALKVPRQGGMTPEQTEKFFREARAAAQLHHPNIVSVHEVGRDDDTVFIVSDFVRGVTLGDWLTGQQLTSREAAELCAKLADALHHAHERGVIHRDLKPANIMIDGDGEPHIMDFGLARREVGEVTVTVDGHILGTPAYMSPEQAQGEAHKADRRSDVYSLGVILFQLLTGELPFRGNARMLVHQVINDEPPSPRKLNSNTPRDLETITLKCLQKSQSSRYLTSLSVGEELRRFLSGTPIHARPIGLVKRSLRWAIRNKVITGLALSLLLVLGIISIVSPTIVFRQSRLLEEGQLFLANSLFEQASNECSSGNVRKGIALFAASLERMQAANSRRESALNLMSNWSTNLGHILVHDGPVRGVAFSPSGQKLVTSSSGKQLQLWDLKSVTRLEQIVTAPSDVRAIAISPDGNCLVSAGADGILQPWQLHPLLSAEAPVRLGLKVNSLAFNPSGDVLAIGGCDNGTTGKAVILDIDSWKQAAPPIFHGNEIWSLAFDQDGQRIVTGSGNWTAQVWDTRTSAPLGSAMRHGGWVLSVAFCPNDMHLLTGNDDGDVQIWSTEMCEKFGKPMPHPNYLGSVAVSHDGLKIASGSWDDLLRLWDAKTQRLVCRDLQHDGAVRSIAFSPDDQSLATASYDSTARVFSLNKVFPSLIEVGSPNKVVVGPDGSSCFEISSDGRCVLWTLKNNEATPQTIDGDDHVTCAIYDFGGKTIAVGYADGAAAIFECKSGKPLGVRSPPLEGGQRVAAIAQADDGRFVLVAFNRNIVQLYYLGEATPAYGPFQHGLGNGSITAVDLCLGSGKLVTASDQDFVYLWDIRTGKLVVDSIKHYGRVNSVAISRDGRKLATGAKDCTMRLWNSETGDPLCDPIRFTDQVLAVCFSPDGCSVASATKDGEMRRWDAISGKPLCNPIEHEGAVYSVAFDSVGRSLFTAASAQNDRTGAIRKWTLPSLIPDRPDLISAWAKFRTGFVVDDLGMIRILSQGEWLESQAELDRLRSNVELP